MNDKWKKRFRNIGIIAGIVTLSFISGLFTGLFGIGRGRIPDTAIAKIEQLQADNQRLTDYAKGLEIGITELRRNQSSLERLSEQLGDNNRRLNNIITEQQANIDELQRLYSVTTGNIELAGSELENIIDDVNRRLQSLTETTP